MSKGKRIVLATHGTLGDLHPYLAIALELKARGHHPLIATSEYYRRKIQDTGIEFHSIRPDQILHDKELHRRFTEPKRGLERVIREFIFPSLRATYDDLLVAVERDGGADLIISQILIFVAPLIAEKTRVPWLSTELQPGAFMSAHDPPVLAPAPTLAKLRGLGPTAHRVFFSFAKLIGSSWSRPVHQLRQELNLPPGKDPLFEGRNSPNLILALFSKILGPPQPDWPRNTLVTGFPFYDEPGATLTPDLAQFLNDGEAPIIFTLGSSAVIDPGNFFRESAVALKMIGKRGVLIVGENPVNAASENLFLVPYAPYDDIFSRGHTVVHHGGIGTTAQAMRAGRPMLVMPFGGDQYDNAARVERLGIGRVIKRNKFSAARLAHELERLSEPNFHDRALEISNQLQRENGVLSACDAIEQQFIG